ncbi:MAG: hypothetical protein KOO60_07330 [Gemmatimonadales bacterium]|nr:hypothetical protein [Gemmatimonadales bacterium]
MTKQEWMKDFTGRIIVFWHDVSTGEGGTIEYVSTDKSSAYAGAKVLTEWDESYPNRLYGLIYNERARYELGRDGVA